MNFFEKHGFETGMVYLPGLDEIIELNENQYFINDGIVDDLNGHTARVYKEFGKEVPKHRLTQTAKGRCVTFPYRGKICSIIFASSDMNRAEQLLTLGHESVHALLHLGREEYFMELIYKFRNILPAGTLDSYWQYDDETKANLGGLIALDKIGLKGTIIQP